jgi:Na+/melibiose symporter-like transporter
MRLVVRHLSPFVRSRRRIPFLLTIVILLSIACILYFINHNRQTEIIINATTVITKVITKNVTIPIQKAAPVLK